MNTTRRTPRIPSFAPLITLMLIVGCGSSQLPEPAPQGAPPRAAEAPAAPAADPTAQQQSAATAAAPSATSENTELTAEAAGVCDLVCEQAKVSGLDDGSSDLARVTKNANGVLQEMQPDLLACYKKRIVAKPQAHAFMTLDVLVGPDGKVRHVETEGGALLGDKTIACIVKRVEKAVFEPPRRGGTLHIFVPFTLRTAAPGAGKD